MVRWLGSTLQAIVAFVKCIRYCGRIFYLEASDNHFPLHDLYVYRLLLLVQLYAFKLIRVKQVCLFPTCLQPFMSITIPPAD